MREHGVARRCSWNDRRRARGPPVPLARLPCFTRVCTDGPRGYTAASPGERYEGAASRPRVTGLRLPRFRSAHGEIARAPGLPRFTCAGCPGLQFFCSPESWRIYEVLIGPGCVRSPIATALLTGWCATAVPSTGALLDFLPMIQPKRLDAFLPAAPPLDGWRDNLPPLPGELALLHRPARPTTSPASHSGASSPRRVRARGAGGDQRPRLPARPQVSR
jgi:hypothetical protein